MFERFCNAAQSNSTGLKVLSHGDLWANNIMFARDPVTGATTDALLVDFQGSCVASPMLDVIYTLFTSSHNDVNGTHWEELLQFYHQELSDCLTKLGFADSIPRLTSLHEELLSKGIFGAIFGMFAVSVRSLVDAEGADMVRLFSDVPADREYRKEIMLKPECRKGLEFLLRYCDRKGFLDF